MTLVSPPVGVAANHLVLLIRMVQSILSLSLWFRFCLWEIVEQVNAISSELTRLWRLALVRRSSTRVGPRPPTAPSLHQL